MKIKFEKALERLEEIVNILEQGDVSLDEALKLFEEGIKLSRICNDKLTKVEEKIKVILGEKDGKIITENFADSDDED